MSGPSVAAQEAGTPIRFAVRYRLAEYVSFAVEGALRTDAFVRDAARWKQVLFRIVLAVLAAATYMWKAWRVGLCLFTIDAHGIERTSRRGTSGVPWARVRAVHVHRRGYLIELVQGAVPIPFRVLSRDARRRFRQLAGPRLQPGRS